MIRPSRAIRLAAAAAAASLVLAACGEDDDTKKDDGKDDGGGTVAKGDGTLTIGTLLPQTGDLANLGPPEFAGVALAVKDINAAGGVNGKPVTEVRGDSGDGTPDIAGATVDKLLDANADVIIGAASSSVSLSVIDKIVGAGVVQFSPANTSPAFDTYDDKGMYFRTAPSDVVQGAVLANLILEDGFQNIAIMARQESYGEGLANKVEADLKAAGATVAVKTFYSPDATNFTAEVNEVAAAQPDAVVLVAFNETTKIIPQLIAKGVGPQDVQMYFVDGNTADYSKDFPPGTLDGVKGTFPQGTELTQEFRTRLLEVDPKLKDFTYGPESYDATIMTALAATAAGDDSGEAIAKEIVNISQGGTKCSEYTECVTLLKDGEDIDYDGFAGPVDMTDTGSPNAATIGINLFGKDNNYKNIDFVKGAI